LLFAERLASSPGILGTEATPPARAGFDWSRDDFVSR
jgi:hypothetical protein